MADVQSRAPLAETTNRGNTYRNVDNGYTHAQKPQHRPQHAASASAMAAHAQANAAALASNAAVSAVMQPQQEQEEKRFSQASYESTSSGRSKRGYKTHIGPWQLGKTLGKGSSARVRLCRHNMTNQLAAVKIVNRRMAYLVQDSSLAALTKWDSNLPDNGSGEMRVPMAIEREVAILKLIEHPHIMKLYDIWENRSEIYLILEYIDQGDLFTFINSRGPLTEEVTLYFFRQMISAITYCHSFNICHRDLKPENILITSDLQIKIADFGMAALQQTDTHLLATACGSPHYAAPELLKNRQYRGDKADIWSLGVILYAMLAATLPFDDPDLRIMMARTKKGHYEMPKFISPEAEDLIKRMLQTNPDRRISLKEIWSHPLVRKYNYLDNFGGNNGLPTDTRKGFQYAPVNHKDIDPQLLRQLRSMWHMFSEHDLAMKLTCDEPNDQKAFYWLLHNYREKQLEDFKPELAHSMSDYHHLKPGVWKKRISTCEFAQPRANGHGRSVSRFTVISNAAETEVGTIQSYDPYRDSRVLQPCESDITHAKITVHRDHPVRSASYGSQRTRYRSGSNARRGRVNPSGTSYTGRPASSRGSLTSLQSSRAGTPHARGPGLRHKRGVDFSHVRKQPNLGARNIPRKASSVSSVNDTTVSRYAGNRSVSPDLPLGHDGQGPKARGAPALVIKTEDPTEIFTEELRHFSSNIAKDCDDAFKSCLPDNGSIAASLADADQTSRGSPFAFSADGSQELTPATDVSTKPWDRPLPPLPGDMTLVGRTEMAEATTSVGSTDDEEPATEHVARAIPVMSPNQVDRRIVSAPAHINNTKRPSALPSLTENKVVDVMSSDKARIVSAPPHTPKRMTHGTPAGVEYLARVENSIRVVHSPTGGSPIKVPAPLNVRKTSAASGVTHQIHRHLAYGAIEEDEDVQRIPSRGSEGVVKKKKSSWFKRVSKAGTESSAASTLMSQDQTTLVNFEGASAPSEAASSDAAKKKKPFSFPFWKSNKSRDLSMMIADEQDELPEIKKGVSKPGKTALARKRMSSASSVRNIEVKQNWLARLFRVKPATDYVCMTISRRRARQEVTILLREWRKYGIRGIQVDKKRNLIFARVGAKNFLNLKEVEFAAEIMTVIEHGRKQPLSIIRFTQERGAASSFYQVVETIKVVFGSRHLLVADENKQKMMIKTLNA